MTGFGTGSGVSDGSGTALLAFHDPLLNGATISALRAVPLLEKKGWRFVFWVPRPGPAYDWLHERGARVYGEPRPISSGLKPLREPPGVVRRLAASPGYLRHFSRLLREVGPEVVHANSLYSFAEALTARALGYPTMLHVHDMAPSSWKVRAASEICRRGVDVSVAVSEACAASYRTDDWAPRVVYEAAPVSPTPVEIRADPTPFAVATVGVIATRKGSDLFVEAAKLVLAEHDGIEFQMIGAPNDPLDRAWGLAVLEAAKEVGVKHRHQANVLEEFPKWDAFALPSRVDPCPIVMLEAMGSGLPVIGTRTDGIAEQITPACGLLVEPESPSALAEAILDLAGRPAEERRAMGAAGRERVANEFSLERQAEGLDRAYRDAIEVADRGRRRRRIAMRG